MAAMLVHKAIRPYWCTKKSGEFNFFRLQKLARAFLLFQEMCITAEHMSQEPKRQTRLASMSVCEGSDNVTSEGQKINLVTPTGFEPMAFPSPGGRSIHV